MQTMLFMISKLRCDLKTRLFCAGKFPAYAIAYAGPQQGCPWCRSYVRFRRLSNCCVLHRFELVGNFVESELREFQDKFVRDQEIRRLLWRLIVLLLLILLWWHILMLVLRGDLLQLELLNLLVVVVLLLRLLVLLLRLLVLLLRLLVVALNSVFFPFTRSGFVPISIE